MQAGQVTETSDYDEIEIEIKGRGRYDNVKAFLVALQDFPKVIAVKTVGMKPQNEKAGVSTPEIEATIKVVTYVFPFENKESEGAGVSQPLNTDQAAAKKLGLTIGEGS